MFYRVVNEFLVRKMVYGTLRRFRAAEDGGMIILSLFLFILMLMMSGMAVDLMRTEKQRVALQNLSDQAILAAAHLNQTADPKKVVESHFAAAGLSGALADVQVSDVNNQRAVMIRTSDFVPTIFMSMMGIDSLPVKSMTVAEHKARDIEISVVLDISSSMNRNGRLENLKAAMTTFVNTLIPEDQTADESQISVSIIPYSLTVNPGVLGPYYRIEGKHAYNDCAFFENEDFDTLAISNTQPLERLSHFADPSSRYAADGTVNLPNCPSVPILPLSIDKEEILNTVKSLRGWDGTGIDIGVKWGLHLLDPSFGNVSRQLALDGTIHGTMMNRPTNFTDQTTDKILILMTDGENDEQRDLWPEFREGPSPVYRSTVDGSHSVLVQDGRQPNGTDTGSFWYHVDTDVILPFPNLPEAAALGVTDWDKVDEVMTHLDWPDVFNVKTTRDLANYFFKTPHAEGYVDDDFYGRISSPIIHRIPQSQTESRIQTICNLAKSKGVTVYGIAFEPPNAASAAVIRNCSTSTGHFFGVEGLDINDAFAAIAQDATVLRLTN